MIGVGGRARQWGSLASRLEKRHGAEQAEQADTAITPGTASEVELLIGDPAKAREKLGWTPKVRFEDLVRMMVDSDLAEQKERAGR